MLNFTNFLSFHTRLNYHRQYNSMHFSENFHVLFKVMGLMANTHRQTDIQTDTRNTSNGVQYNYRYAAK